MSPGQRVLVCVSSDARLQGDWLPASTVNSVTDVVKQSEVAAMELPYVTLPSIVRYCTRIMALQHDTLHSTLLGAHAGKLVHNLVKWWPITAYDISMESSHQGPSENVFVCVLQRHRAQLRDHFEETQHVAAPLWKGC